MISSIAMQLIIHVQIVVQFILNMFKGNANLARIAELPIPIYTIRCGGSLALLLPKCSGPRCAKHVAVVPCAEINCGTKNIPSLIETTAVCPYSSIHNTSEYRPDGLPFFTSVVVHLLPRLRAFPPPCMRPERRLYPCSHRGATLKPQ